MLPLVVIDDVLDIAAESTCTILGTRVAAAVHGLTNDASEVRTRVARHGEEADGARALPSPVESGPLHEVIATGRPRRLRLGDRRGVTGGWPGDESAGGEGRPSPGVSWIGVPIMGTGGQVIGAIEAIDPLDRRSFDREDEETLALLAAISSLSIRSCLLYQASIDARARLGWAAHVERLRAAELQAAIASIGEAVLVFDGRGEVNLTNPAADRLFEAAPVRSIEELRARFGAPGDRPLTAPIELQVPGPPSTWLELRVYAVPGQASRAEGPPSGQIAVIRDVTAARQERAQREAFLGILSHELRTPITTIYAGSKLLMRGEAGKGGPRDDLAADINAEAERLFRLVEDLLVMTRSERGVLELAREPVLLQRVAAAAIRLERTRWPTTRFILSGPSDLPAVSGDSLYVEQVVRNLLSNAAKYGPPSSEVEVLLEEGRDEMTIRVLDRGTGFLTNEVDDLFELFYRSPTTAAQAAGAGIGLFVCRRLVNAMGGRIWAGPRADGGAEFAFALPTYPSAD